MERAVHVSATSVRSYFRTQQAQRLSASANGTKWKSIRGRTCQQARLSCTATPLACSLVMRAGSIVPDPSRPSVRPLGAISTLLKDRLVTLTRSYIWLGSEKRKQGPEKRLGHRSSGNGKPGWPHDDMDVLYPILRQPGINKLNPLTPLEWPLALWSSYARLLSTGRIQRWTMVAPIPLLLINLPTLTEHVAERPQ
jgi:hypothetical protein